MKNAHRRPGPIRTYLPDALGHLALRVGLVLVFVGSLYIADWWAHH